MAHPIDFPGSNLLLTAPADLEHKVVPLAARRANGAIVSCWLLTAEDLRRIAETGEVWLSVMGDSSPPVLVTGLREDVIDG